MRPSEYTPEKLDLARAYIDGGWSEQGDAVPQIAGLALAVGIHRDTVYQWAKDEDKKEFSDILTRVMHSQERCLVNDGLRGTFNPAITKMMLSKHGYSDKQAVDHTTNGESITRIERVIIDIPSDQDA
jgi:hypothetical protein